VPESADVQQTMTAQDDTHACAQPVSAEQDARAATSAPDRAKASRPLTFRGRLQRKPFTAGVLKSVLENNSNAQGKLVWRGCATVSADGQLDQSPATGCDEQTPIDDSAAARFRQASARMPHYRSPHESFHIQHSNAAVVRRVAARIAQHCAPSHNWETRRHELATSIRTLVIISSLILHHACNGDVSPHEQRTCTVARSIQLLGLTPSHRQQVDRLTGCVTARQCIEPRACPPSSRIWATLWRELAQTAAGAGRNGNGCLAAASTTCTAQSGKVAAKLSAEEQHGSAASTSKAQQVAGRVLDKVEHNMARVWEEARPAAQHARHERRAIVELERHRAVAARRAELRAAWCAPRAQSQPFLDRWCLAATEWVAWLGVLTEANWW
jgi:hypothetical protein